MIKDNAQIEADMQKYIDEHYPPMMREKALRLGGVLLDDLNAFFVSMSVLKAERIAARDFDQSVKDYGDAITQLPNEPAVISITDDKGNSVEVINPRLTELQAVVKAASKEVIAAYEAAQL